MSAIENGCENTLCHEYIGNYVDGCPPLLVYSIYGKLNCLLEFNFTWWFNGGITIHCGSISFTWYALR